MRARIDRPPCRDTWLASSVTVVAGTMKRLYDERVRVSPHNFAVGSELAAISIVYGRFDGESSQASSTAGVSAPKGLDTSYLRPHFDVPLTVPVGAVSFRTALENRGRVRGLRRDFMHQHNPFHGNRLCPAGPAGNPAKSNFLNRPRLVIWPND